MRVFLFAIALSSVAISSILAKPFFNNVKDSEDGTTTFQLDSDFNGLEKDFLQPNDLLAARTNYNREKREDDTNKTKAQKGIPTFNEIPNIQNEKSDLDLIESNKLGSSGNTNQFSQTGFPLFQGIPNFSGIPNGPKMPNILNSENNQSGSSAPLNFPNIFSNLPSVPQFQSKIDIPNLQNGIPNFFGNQNQQNGIPNLQNLIPNLQNGIPNLQNGISNLQNLIPNFQNGIQGLQNGLPNLLNGIPNLQNGIQSLQNGIPNLQKGISDLQNGLLNNFNPNAHFGLHTHLGLPTLTGLPNLPFGLDPQQALQNLNLPQLEAIYNKLKTEAGNNKSNNFLQDLLKNFDFFMKGVRDFFGNMTGGLTNRVSDDFNKFISNVLPFGNRN